MPRRRCPPASHEALTAGKISSGRVSGHPATADCSGNDGMVAGGEGFGRNVCCCWMGAGSGLGRTGRPGSWGKREKRRERIMGNGGGWWDISLRRWVSEKAWLLSVGMKENEGKKESVME